MGAWTSSSGVSPTITASLASASRASHARWKIRRYGLSRRQFGVHDKVEAQAVVVQASHQVVVIGVGDYCNYTGSDGPAPAMRPAPAGRSPPACACMSAYASANCPAAGSRPNGAQPTACCQPRCPVRHEARNAILIRLAADHLGVPAVEFAGFQRQAELPGEVVEPAGSDRVAEVDQRAVEVQQHRANWCRTTRMASRPAIMPSTTEVRVRAG